MKPNRLLKTDLCLNLLKVIEAVQWIQDVGKSNEDTDDLNLGKPIFLWSVSKTQSVGENVEKLKTSYTSSGSMNWYHHFGKLAVSPKANHSHTLWLHHSTPRYTLNRNAYICAAKYIQKCL